MSVNCISYFCKKNNKNSSMKERNHKKIENLCEVKEAYEAPKCEIIELENEGVLCLSDGYPNPGYGKSLDSYGW